MANQETKIENLKALSFDSLKNEKQYYINLIDQTEGKIKFPQYYSESIIQLDEENLRHFEKMLIEVEKEMASRPEILTYKEKIDQINSKKSKKESSESKLKQLSTSDLGVLYNYLENKRKILKVESMKVKVTLRMIIVLKEIDRRLDNIFE